MSYWILSTTWSPPPLQVRWLLKEKTWEKHTRRRIDLDFQRHKRQCRACEVRRWKQKRHKACQRYLSLNVRFENEKAEKAVWKWKWTSVTGRKKKHPKKDDYISILSGNQVREANKKNVPGRKWRRKGLPRKDNCILINRL